MVKLELIPLLNVQRELHAMPPGPARFRAYIDVMTQGQEDIAVPLAQMNPMGKDHVAALIDKLIAMNTEEAVTAVFAEVQQRLPHVDAGLGVGLVLVDDLAGSWTNSYLTDATERFEGDYILKNNWSLVNVWTSQAWDIAKLQRETLASVYRSLYKQRYGLPETLYEMMRQEGLVARFAGEVLSFSEEELSYSQDIIASHKYTAHHPTAFACLYGDEGALAAGYPTLGLQARAGFEVALAEALTDARTPEQYLG